LAGSSILNASRPIDAVDYSKARIKSAQCRCRFSRFMGETELIITTSISPCVDCNLGDSTVSRALRTP